MSQSGKHSKGYKVPDKKQMPSKTAAVKHPWANLLEEKPWIYVILLFAISQYIIFPHRLPEDVSAGFGHDSVAGCGAYHH
jgi:hypothetical protein